MVAYRVRERIASDTEWADALIGRYQGARLTARLGQVFDPLAFPGLVAEDEAGVPMGLATCRFEDGEMELLTLHAETGGRGVGSALLGAAVSWARDNAVHRLWLVTTNDNVEALHFYLRHGMHVTAVHAGAVDADRALKPGIPPVNDSNRIPIRDLVEFDLELASWTPAPIAFPAVRDLDRLPAEACAAELAPLFEGAPAFCVELARARPFGSDEGLIAAARQVARELAEPAAVELVNAHPRIGADPASVSSLSHTEQGYDDEHPPDPDWVAEELAVLNEVYEERFGFRYTVFVAGRSREEVIGLLEHGLRNDRAAELRRATDDCVSIAADRLRRLRGEG